jgi:hypothetical protein
MPNPAPNVNSVSNAGGIQGPSYKWVRINGVSEQSLNINFDGNPNSATPVYYDGARFTNDPSSGNQVLEVTSLAVLPNGSQKMVQYLVASVPITLPPFLAALTLSGSPGNSAAFQPPSPTYNTQYAVKGDDQHCSGNLTGQKYPAIGVFTSSDRNSVASGIPTALQPNYTGVNNPGPIVPDVEDISSSFPGSMQTPSQLDSIAQTIVQNADVIIPSGPVTYPLPTVTGSALTALGMSSTNPLTVVVNGNLNISNWSHDGYGLLLVTGTFTYDPDTNWYGIILVIGQGAVNNVEHGQYMQINGAMFVAKTRDSSGNLLPDPKLGGASVAFDAPMQGNGIRYSSCWIQKAQPTSSYKILSFHEIPQ